MSYYGQRTTYQYMGIGCAVFGAFYLTFSLTYIKRKQRREAEKEKSRPMEVFCSNSQKPLKMNADADPEAAQSMLPNPADAA